MIPVLLGLLAAGVSSVGVGWIRSRHGTRLLDIPNARSSHGTPIPRGGGLGILAGLAVGLLAALAVAPANVPWRTVGPVLLGAGFVAGVSFVDDLRPVRPALRLGVHIMAAALALAALGVPTRVVLPGLMPFDLGWAAWPVGGLWIIGLTNIYNFMDGIDGIAGSVAVVAGLGWWAFGMWAGLTAVAIGGALVFGAAGGFLLHNWPPAAIFLGDVGSTLLGYVLAVLPLGASALTAGPPRDGRAWTMAVVLLWAFLLDAVVTLVRRAWRCENIVAAHRSHWYQRLVIAGWTHRSVALLYTSAVLVSTVSVALWLSEASGWIAPWVAILGISLGLPSLVLHQEKKLRKAGDS